MLSGFPITLSWSNFTLSDGYELLISNNVVIRLQLNDHLIILEPVSPDIQLYQFLLLYMPLMDNLNAILLSLRSSDVESYSSGTGLKKRNMETKSKTLLISIAFGILERCFAWTYVMTLWWQRTCIFVPFFSKQQPRASIEHLHFRSIFRHFGRFACSKIIDPCM